MTTRIDHYCRVFLTRNSHCGNAESITKSVRFCQASNPATLSKLRYHDVWRTKRYRPTVEALESRLVLAAPEIVEIQPAANLHTASVEADVSVRYDQDVDGNTVSPETFTVHGAQTGRLTEPSNPVLVRNGNKVTFSHPQPFHPGELLEATATTDIKSIDGEASRAPIVWQFRTGVGKGTGLGSGFFEDVGQTLENQSTPRAVTLCDLDDDGDLDAFLGNHVWLNDGNGGLELDRRTDFDDEGNLAVALGDLDGDGDLDAFVTNSFFNQLWLNDGTGKFVNTGEGLGRSDSDYFFSGPLALGDLDGDGDLDAIVGGERDESSYVWLNNGSGETGDYSGNSVGYPTDYAVDLGDVDSDGDLDAIFVGSDAHTVWLNDGDGEFTDSGQDFVDEAGYAPITSDVALGDVDGDGDLDAFFAKLAQAHITSGAPNAVWLNDGNGNFADSGQRLGNSWSLDAALGDVDGDGDLDAFVGNTARAPDAIWLNDGTGTFSKNGQSLGNSWSSRVALGDLDGDGDLDGLVGSSDPSTVWFNADRDSVTDLSVTVTDDLDMTVAGQSLTYTINVVNSGPIDVAEASLTDSFAARLTDVNWTCTASAGSNCTASGTGDINDKISLLIGGSATYTATGRVLPLTVGMLTNEATVSVPSGILDTVVENNTATDQTNVPLVVAPAPSTHLAPVSGGISLAYEDDITPNTVSDESLVVIGAWTGQLLGTGNKTVRKNVVTYTPTQPFHPGELLQVTATTDIKHLDGESLSAPFVWHFRTAVGIGNNSGTGRFTSRGSMSHLNGEGDIALGDFDGDGDLDALVVGEGSQRSNVWQNDGTGAFEDQGQRFGDSSSVVALGDVDGDGDLDAFVGTVVGGTNMVWLNDGTGVFEESGQRLKEGFLSVPRAVALGDVDGDGDLDAFVGNRAACKIIRCWGANYVWLNDGHGTFTDSGQRLGSSGTNSVVLGDVDGDGDLDAVVGNRREGHALMVWLNDGHGTFAKSGQSLGRADIQDVVLGDVDGDGDLDILAGNDNFEQPNEIWLNDGSGTFADSGQQLGEFNTNAVALGDVDGDGDLDAIIGDSDEPANTLWLNDGNGKFTESKHRLEDSDARAVALGDLDGDGDLDVASLGFDELTWYENLDHVPGDSNNDGVFNSTDLTLVFQAGEYEDGIAGNSTFAEGDWNSDGDFDTSDLVFAFQEGNYIAAAIPVNFQVAAALNPPPGRTNANDELSPSSSQPNIQAGEIPSSRRLPALVIDAVFAQHDATDIVDIGAKSDDRSLQESKFTTFKED